MIDKFLDEISDEVGEVEFVLKYEGWSPTCFPDMLDEVQYEDYAEMESYRIIDAWNKSMLEGGYAYVDGGYREGGLYGVTWALYRKCD